MKKIWSALLAIWIPFLLQSQTIPLKVKCQLPAVINESSGVAVSNANSIWSLNDSGGKPELYNFDSSGALLRTLRISNARNVDWEELTKDREGNLYAGDFGNNNNARKDLRIYKIPNPATIKGNSVKAEIISFTYPEQNAFPPADSLKNFDMEAMVAFNHHLYLFSKNRTRPYNGFTKLYRLPDTAGTYTATLLDSFFIPRDTAYWVSITGAALSPDGSRLALLNGKSIRLFSNYTGDNFFKGTMRPFFFDKITQKEALCFVTNDDLYITDEFNDPPVGGQQLYHLSLLPHLQQPLPKVTGIGGIFFKSQNKKELKAWYSRNLGLETNEYGSTFEMRNANRPEEINYLEWSPFSEKTKYFEPSAKQFMINYRVQNMEALVDNLRQSGVTIVDSIETYDYGKFVHILDLEGNKLELWEPIDSVLTKIGSKTTK